MKHICISKPTIICSDNGLSPHQRQAIGLSPSQHWAIIRTNAGMLVIGSLETNFGVIWIKIDIHWRKCTWQYRLQNSGHLCLGLNLLKIEEVTVLLDLQSCKIFIPETLLRYAQTRNISKILLSSTVMTWSNLPGYYIRHCANSGRKWIWY